MVDTCEFSYISRVDSLPKQVLGIERSWEQLKLELDRTGSGYPGAIYFKTITYQGPQLFAVVDDGTVLYHEGNGWHRYITAFDVRFGTMESTNLNPPRATSDTVITGQDRDQSDWVFVSNNENK